MIASVHIQVADRKGIAFLKNAYCSTPFKVANITENKTGAVLHLMLMSSSPGILDGDQYTIAIEVEKNCSLQLHTQAYQRLFLMKAGASQKMTVHMADGATFCFLPHPCVPHEQSVFTSINSFYLGKNCRFVYGEILTCGRKLNGEIFLLTKYHSSNAIYIQNKLVVKENLLLQPALINVKAIGQLEGYTHQASMIYLQKGINIKTLQQEIIKLLSAETNITAGVSITPVNGIIIRILGTGAEQLYNCLQKINLILPTIPVTIIEHAA